VSAKALLATTASAAGVGAHDSAAGISATDHAAALAAGQLYELVGVLVHSGTADSGHYYSYIKERRTASVASGAGSGGPGCWLHFNDTLVEPFAERDLPFDYVLYTSYERQVQGLLRGEHHVAWNSPLAWLQAERAAAAQGRRAHAVAMRDTDRDLTSVLVVRAESDVTRAADLDGRTVGFGATDSPQATLIPRAHLRVPVRERLFDVLVGKHGDHIGGERDAAWALLLLD
jgi:hypothetical protein